MCLRFQFCTHQMACILHFQKKSQIRCTLLDNTVPLNFFYEYICKLFTYTVVFVSFPGAVSSLQQDETQLVTYENVPLWRPQRHNRILNF